MFAHIQDAEGFAGDFGARERVRGMLRSLEQEDGAGPHRPAMRGVPLDRLPEGRVRDLVIAQVVDGVHAIFQVDEREPGVGEAYWILIWCGRVET